MIDLHCHVLPGIDDGPATLAESIELARAAAAAGTRVIVATPHVDWRWRNEASTIAPLVDDVNAALRELRIDLTVRPGAEIAMTRAVELSDQELHALALGGGGWALIEPPFTQVSTGLDLMVADVMRRGLRVILAHPERCAAFQRDPDKLVALTDSGALVSVTAGSLIGVFGQRVRRFAMELVQTGLVHNVASDAHDAVRRAPGAASALAAAGLEPLAEWLTEAVPAAILDGGEIPPRPAVALRRPRRRWSVPWRLRGDG